MTDQELLTVAESTLRDAIQEVEFTRLQKDLQYVLMVATKIEELKAEIGRYEPPVEVAVVRLVAGRVEITRTMKGIPRFAK